MTPRPYQQKGRLAVHEAWKHYQRVLVVWPTGAGKTILFSLIASDVVQQGGRVLILADRHELLQQAQQKLSYVTGLDSALEKADSSAYGELERVTVGSVQTMMNLSRLERFPRDYYTHIIVDECDKCLADSYQRIFSYFEKAKVLGVTATPDHRR
jgi:superfamily II DNA or RNA helicase